MRADECEDGMQQRGTVSGMAEILVVKGVLRADHCARGWEEDVRRVEEKRVWAV